MKCAEFNNDPRFLRRSREGAWIEMAIWLQYCRSCDVAPVRERGLKWKIILKMIMKNFVAPVRERGLKLVNSQASAAIYPVAPVRERGLKCSYWLIWNEWFRRSREGAWIEIFL